MLRCSFSAQASAESGLFGYTLGCVRPITAGFRGFLSHTIHSRKDRIMAARTVDAATVRGEAHKLIVTINQNWDRLTVEAQDAIAQSLLMVLGSGPSMAALQGMLSQEQANGLMYHNAVSQQQKTNLLGMAMTAKCVGYMLDPNAAAQVDTLFDQES